jgi:hypothetical protein
VDGALQDALLRTLNQLAARLLMTMRDASACPWQYDALIASVLQPTPHRPEERRTNAMPDGLTQRLLDRWVAQSPSGGGCTLPGCGCTPPRGLYLFQTCHPGRGFRVHALASGTLLVQCGGCPAVLARLAVTDSQDSGPVMAPCHPRSRLRVGYLVGGTVLIECDRCLAMVQRLTVQGEA